MQDQNDVSVKLKAVEGQLKVTQGQLRCSEERFSELLDQEKKQWEAEVTLIKQQHQKEVSSLKEQIATLTTELTTKAVKPQPQVSLPSPGRSRKKATGHAERRPSELANNIAKHLNLPAEDRLSKSVNNLANWNSDEDDGSRGASNKVTITELVEESLKKPESIAAIRKELKDAKLTPRIRRKFGTDTRPPPLKEIECPRDDHTPTSPLATNLQVYQSNAL